MTLKKLMAVEDDTDIRRILDLALTTFGGFELTLCESGEAALIALEGERPDLILLDVMMPGLDGPGTLRAIREHPELAGIPVVFVTAKLQPDEVASWKALGAMAVIGKPFDPMTLPDELRQLYSDHPSAIADSPTAIGLPRELEALRPDYLDRVHRDIDRLEVIAGQILGCGDPQGCRIELAELQSVLHGLAGSAGPFGFTALGRQCRELEQISGRWREPVASPTLRDWHRLAADLLLLRQYLP